MFLNKIRSLGNSLLFRLTVLYTVAFTLLALISFTIFYFRIYSVTMARMDHELLEDTEVYSGILSQLGIDGLKDKMAEEAESEDPEDEFFRLSDINGNTVETSDMSSWGLVDLKDTISKLQGDKINHIFQTIVLPEDGYEARMVSAVIGPGIVLQIGETLEEADEYLKIFRNLFSILMGVLIAVSTLIGWYLARCIDRHGGGYPYRRGYIERLIRSTGGRQRQVERNRKAEYDFQQDVGSDPDTVELDERDQR